MANKKYGKIKIKKISPVLADIPEDCGYDKQFEPTNHMISMRLNGFEDRGRHQPSKHFQLKNDRFLTKRINSTGLA